MSGDTKLVLAFFESEAAADEAAQALKRWDQATDEIKLGNVGVLVKDQYNEVKEHKLGPRTGKKGAGIGMVLGLVAAVPTGGMSLVGGAISGGVAGGAVGALFHKGLPKKDLEQIGDQLGNGHAAVGLLVDGPEEARVTAKLVELGGSPEAHAIPVDSLAAGELVGAESQDAVQGEPTSASGAGEAAADGRKDSASLQVRLDPEEAEILRDVINQYMADLRGEIGDTDSRQVRAALHRREAVLKKIAGLIAEPAQV